MSNYIISTDSCCDLPKEYIEQHSIYEEPLYFIIDDITYGGDNDMDPKQFYQLMRDGAAPKTSAANVDNAMNAFRKYLEVGKDILHISFTSGLSCSYNNIVLAANQLLEEFPERKIVVIDSLCASLGLGLLVHYAVQKKEAGASLDEVAEWVETNKHRICHQFTVEHLQYLQRGGRVSKTTAIIGTLINVKPVLHINETGHIVPLNNVRGRKKSLISLVDNMAAHMDDDNSCIFISHGDSLEDAQFVGNLVKERFGIDDIMYHYVSPTVGSHSGPGTIALFYLGNQR